MSLATNSDSRLQTQVSEKNKPPQSLQAVNRFLLHFSRPPLTFLTRKNRVQTSHDPGHIINGGEIGAARFPSFPPGSPDCCGCSAGCPHCVCCAKCCASVFYRPPAFWRPASFVSELFVSSKFFFFTSHASSFKAECRCEPSGEHKLDTFTFCCARAPCDVWP